MLHRPGLELERLTPSTVHDLLFEDVLWAERAREEHDAFAALLREHGVVVDHFSTLLAEALDVPGAREFLADRLATATRFGPALDRPLRRVLEDAPAGWLAPRLIGGLLKHDLPAPEISSLLWASLAPEDFLLSPLPNHLFQRDNVAWVYCGLLREPDGDARPPARGAELPARLPLPPPVRGRAVRYYGDDDEPHGARRSKAATCSSSATASCSSA